MFERLKTRDAVSPLVDRDAALKQEYAEATAERTELLSRRPSKPSLIDAMSRQVDALADAWREHYAERLTAAVAGWLELDAAGTVQVRPGNLLQAGALPTVLSFEDLAGLVPSQVKASLVRAIESSAPYEPGAPLEERPARITKLEARLQAIERQHAELVDEAAARGVVLEHMEAERLRRFLKEQRREQAASFNLANQAAIRRGSVPPMEAE